MKTDRAGVCGTDWNLWIFFGLAYALSWAFWIPAALLHSESLFPLVLMLYAIGGFGPTVAGILFIGRTLDKPVQADFVRRLTGFKCIGALLPLTLPLAFSTPLRANCTCT